MRKGVDGFTAARTSLSVVAVPLLIYLAAVALYPRLLDEMPTAVAWFGRPNSAVTIAVVAAVLFTVAALLFRSRGAGKSGAPVAVVAGLALISLFLGLASYWNCHDANHPRFFTTLIWTAGVVKGGTGPQSLDAGVCPSPTPVALEIARLSALAAVFLGVFGVVAALFQSRVDALRVRFAHTLTVVVGLDDDSLSMVAAVARTLRRGETLVVVTALPDRACVRLARSRGARIVTVDLSRPEALASLPVWRRLNRLYLLSVDPSTNLRRLADITQRVSELDQRQRIPLIVRIDDPWQAMAWRAQHFGAENRWAADAVGRYEVTARRLLDEVTAEPGIERVLVCGGSQLTLALCADMAQRQLEHDYYAADGARLPAMTLVAERADDYTSDHQFLCGKLGLPPNRPEVTSVSATPTAAQIISLIGDSGAARTAVVLVDAGEIEASTGTRLAARLPAAPIWAWDPAAEVAGDRLALLGRLRTFRLSMDLPRGQAHDAWERAARLIHDRYAAEQAHHTPATLPWAELDEFYRGSNRRQVQNALWMVEKIGGHSWNTFDSPADGLSTATLRGRPPSEQLRLMGFDEQTALAMARAEHEDWCRYLRAHGWRYGAVRDDAAKVHDKLVDWTAVERDPDLRDRALSSLAATLSKLRELGYRSRPLTERNDSARWQPFRRAGTVIAERRDDDWTWTTRSGDTMRAGAGDWAVRDLEGDHWWSVRDDIFRAQYEHLDGARFRRFGTVRARPADDGEVVATLEGPVAATGGDWVVEGSQGERWPVSGDEFARRYRRLDDG
ncbi:hypothetical protein JRC04_07940 [Mycolicibacterium sp. S2-37]|nr:hypothetical protein [Mycolicibacterium sp. S2-37]